MYKKNVIYVAFLQDNLDRIKHFILEKMSGRRGIFNSDNIAEKILKESSELVVLDLKLIIK
ncbi:hypothetical protein CP118TE_10570 [Clostridium perfringens E]|nr:hypothetical protein CP118TE_10570 [Clostridium perfringens E]